ncbi:hypothetical protein Goarm_004075 [Gossypium armourianum]|uniref:Uncharacterized protein n=1 Tax=Gossypium armourianum TaxID=34283 RepID=A0A7J9K5C2_9ROSI|nr:hypothetical protein [Gossypium armourianum]
MAAKTVSLKLLVDSMSQRVLFAEAGKDFVDFPRDYERYLHSANSKDTLLKPIASIKAAIVPPLLPTTESSKSIEIYRCRNTYHRSTCSLHVEGDYKSIFLAMMLWTKLQPLVNPQKKDSSTDEGGYVKGVITYMIMDDLVVRPMPSISCITLLNKFNIKDIGVLEENTLMSE